MSLEYQYYKKESFLFRKLYNLEMKIRRIFKRKNTNSVEYINTSKLLVYKPSYFISWLKWKFSKKVKINPITELNLPIIKNGFGKSWMKYSTDLKKKDNL
jgi:hypothetical protein